MLKRPGILAVASAPTRFALPPRRVGSTSALGTGRRREAPPAWGFNS